MDANLFSEGAIYYYENNTNTKRDYDNKELNHDFLVSRPVYIIGTVNPFTSYTINVLALTSNLERPGIPVNVTGWRRGKIIPYCTYSIHKEYLTRYMGHVSPELQQEIRDAYKFHCGFSQDLPIYIKKEEERKFEIENIVKTLTPKEKTVYQFITSKCSFGDFLYCDLHDLWDSYLSSKYVTKYEMISNFSKAMTKLLKLFPYIQMDEDLEESDTVIYRGMCLKHILKSKQTQIELKALSRREIATGPSKTVIESDTLKMTKDELLDHLTSESLKKFKKMGVIEKIKNWRLNPDESKLDIQNVSDLWIIKRLIALELEPLQKKMFCELDTKVNPNNFSASKKYLLLRSSDKEIRAHVDAKFLKKGIGKLRHQLRGSIGYLLR